MLASAFSDALRLLAGDAMEDFLENADVFFLIDDGSEAASAKKWVSVVRGPLALWSPAPRYLYKANSRLSTFIQTNPGNRVNGTKNKVRVVETFAEQVHKTPRNIDTTNFLPHPESHAAPISVR